MKMYQQPTANGTKPAVAGKKWPPVNTNVGVSAAPVQLPKPTVPVKPMTKPKHVSSALHGVRNSPHQNNNENIPAWKRELMKAKEQANASKPEVVDSKPFPIKPEGTNTGLANRKALFENKTEERVKPDVKTPPVKTWQPNRRDSASSNDSVSSARNANKKPPPSLPNKPKPSSTEKPKPSFLHSPVANAKSKSHEFPPPPIFHQPFSGPRRREIPSHVYERPPPSKPYRPPGVNINSFLHNKSPRHNIHELPPHLPDASYHPANRPPLPIPDKQQPPLPQLPVPSPAMSLAQRPLPSPNLPPPIEDDEEEVYDLPPEEIPPPPSPALPPRPSNQIPTCDDSEDEDGAIYDETAPDLPPIGLPPPNDSIEQYVAGDGEIYESVEEYMRFKGQTQTVEDNPSNEKQKKLEEKRRKDSEKKEKKMRKEFNLAKDMKIIAEAQGIVNADARGRGKDLSVTQHEKVEVIRMTNNPKGKWLVRNQQGMYGYLESNNVTIDVGILKTTMYHGGAQSIIPTMDEDEEEGVIYDETPDTVGFEDNEDLYEEFGD